MHRLIMRAGVLTLFVVFGAATAFAQPVEHGLDRFDPYDPSDAQLLSEYGGALATELPMRELRQLDIYNPTEAAIRRDYGGGLPLWVWYPLYAPGPVPYVRRPPPMRHSTPPPPAHGEPQARSRRRAPAAEMELGPTGPPGPTRMGTLMKPESNDGVWIEFEGRRWLSAGKAVPFDPVTFQRAGEHNGFVVYRRAVGTDGLIYLPTREGLVAPYRLK